MPVTAKWALLITTDPVSSPRDPRVTLTHAGLRGTDEPSPRRCLVRTGAGPAAILLAPSSELSGNAAQALTKAS